MKTAQHSGKIGDILAGIPYYRALGIDCLYLRNSHEFHNEAIEAILPLLNYQPGLKAFHDNETKPDINLDLFRAIGMPLDKGHLAKWYCYAFQVDVDLTKPWLKRPPPPDADHVDAIVVNRSLTHRNSGIDYSFLNKYPHVIFLGTQHEFLFFRNECRKAKWVKTKDMLEAAKIIAQAKVYIGNSTGPWWCAEGLGVPRVMEIFPQAPVCQPMTPNGYDCLYQPHMIDTVRRLYGST